MYIVESNIEHIYIYMPCTVHYLSHLGMALRLEFCIRNRFSFFWNNLHENTQNLKDYRDLKTVLEYNSSTILFIFCLSTRPCSTDYSCLPHDKEMWILLIQVAMWAQQYILWKHMLCVTEWKWTENRMEQILEMLFDNLNKKDGHKVQQHTQL